jgi:hypothetical protein
MSILSQFQNVEPLRAPSNVPSSRFAVTLRWRLFVLPISCSNDATIEE